MLQSANMERRNCKNLTPIKSKILFEETSEEGETLPHLKSKFSSPSTIDSPLRSSRG